MPEFTIKISTPEKGLERMSSRGAGKPVHKPFARSGAAENGPGSPGMRRDSRESLDEEGTDGLIATLIRQIAQSLNLESRTATTTAPATEATPVIATRSAGGNPKEDHAAAADPHADASFANANSTAATDLRRLLADDQIRSAVEPLMARIVGPMLEALVTPLIAEVNAQAERGALGSKNPAAGIQAAERRPHGDAQIRSRLPHDPGSPRETRRDVRRPSARREEPAHEERRPVRPLGFVPSRAPEQRRGRKRPNGSFTIHGYHDPQADEEGLHTGSLTTGDLGGNVRTTAAEALADAPAYVPRFPSPSDQAATETSSVAPVVDPRLSAPGTNPPDAVAAAQSAVNPNGTDELTETAQQTAASTADAARSAQEALGALRELAASSHQQAEAYQELKREVDDLRSQLANRA